MLRLILVPLAAMRIICAVLASVLLVGAVPDAQADVVSFTLDNVTFNGGGTATGSFAFDSATDALSNVDIVTSNAPIDNLSFFGRTYTSGSYASGEFTFGPTIFSTLKFAVSSLSLTNPNPIIIGSNSFESVFEVNPNCDPTTGCLPVQNITRFVATGSLDPSSNVSTVALPAALPLFATGLGALGLLGWRRKKKLRGLDRPSCV